MGGTLGQGPNDLNIYKDISHSVSTFAPRAKNWARGHPALIHFILDLLSRLPHIFKEQEETLQCSGRNKTIEKLKLQLDYVP